MSSETTIILPGGIIVDGTLRKDAIFHPVTGRVEQLISEIVASNKYTPEKFTAVLVAALYKIAGKTPSSELVNSLSVADRQYLMMQLAIVLEGNVVWLHLWCSNCSSRFDVEIDRMQLPVIRASGDYPYANMESQSHKIKLKVPTGEVQSKLAVCDEVESMDVLLRFCIDSVNNIKPEKEFFNQLTDNDLVSMESALEAVSPFVCSEITTQCPECGGEQKITQDAYSLTSYSAGTLYKDIHTLASHYHWSEDEILSLPKERRQLYLKYIEAGRGIYM